MVTAHSTKDTTMWNSRVFFSAAALALFASLSSPASAQEAPGGEWRRSVSLMGGAFNSDFSETETFGMAAVRADWRLSRVLLAEVGGSYERGRVEVGNYTAGTPTFSMETTRLATATVGVQAELPLAYVRPYVGISTGLFLRLDPPGGDRFLSTTQAFPVGVRVPLTERLGARAEVRLRYDNHWGTEGTALGAEAGVGVSLRF